MDPHLHLAQQRFLLTPTAPANLKLDRYLGSLTSSHPHPSLRLLRADLRSTVSYPRVVSFFTGEEA